MGPGALISRFVRHRNAANLLMALMLIAGIFAGFRLNTQFFPDFGIDIVSVTVEWPGAAAEDVEANIVAAIEPEVRFLDSVKKVTSYAVEGLASIVIEFEPGADMQAALSNVDSAVAQITTLPDDSERPKVSRLVRYDPIARLVVSGPYSEVSLKAIAKRLRDGLLDRDIDKVDLFGARDEEIRVAIPGQVLRRLNLTFDDIATRIAGSSLDLPSGTLSDDFERQIRSLGLVKAATALGEIEVRSLASGEKIYLKDIATLKETFDKDEPIGVRNGQPAIELSIRRAVDTDALKAADIVNDYLAEIGPTLPPNLKLETYDVQVSLIRDRINLLLRNGASGLVLVLLVLFVFLSGRVAFWVAMGIPVSVFATGGVMILTGQSINMVSLFAMIMTLGIIVDDAIVVGEHAV